jgi:hypothetical protein
MVHRHDISGPRADECGIEHQRDVIELFQVFGDKRDAFLQSSPCIVAWLPICPSSLPIPWNAGLLQVLVARTTTGLARSERQRLSRHSKLSAESDVTIIDRPGLHILCLSNDWPSDRLID